MFITILYLKAFEKLINYVFQINLKINLKVKIR